MITTKKKIGEAVRDELPLFTLSELRERIASTMEEPPCLIEFTRRNGFAWWHTGLDCMIALPGVAVALNGHEPLGIELLDRGARSDLLGWEWSYLMHFEMAVNNLFAGDIRAYNFTGYFPKMREQYLPKIDETNWYLLYKLMEK